MVSNIPVVTTKAPDVQSASLLPLRLKYDAVADVQDPADFKILEALDMAQNLMPPGLQCKYIQFDTVLVWYNRSQTRVLHQHDILIWGAGGMHMVLYCCQLTFLDLFSLDDMSKALH